MDYNLELTKLKQKEKELLKNAEKEGYRLINGKLAKKEFIPVIEIYARAETDYESSGGFMVFKKTIPLTNKQFDRIKSLEQTPKSIINDFLYDDVLDNIKELEFLWEILEVGRDLEEEDIKRIVEDLDEEYSCLEEDQNLYLEFFFNKSNLDGYMSVYDLPIEELDKQDNIQLCLNKYLTWN